MQLTHDWYNPSVSLAQDSMHVEPEKHFKNIRKTFLCCYFTCLPNKWNFCILHAQHYFNHDDEKIMFGLARKIKRSENQVDIWRLTEVSTKYTGWVTKL